MNNELPTTGNIKAGDQWQVSTETSRADQLKAEIESINAEIQKAIDDENKARNAQHWAKKRLKVAKDELTELSNS